MHSPLPTPLPSDPPPLTPPGLPSRMGPSRVVARLRAGEPVVLAKANFQDPQLVELVASTGFDAVWLCLEHRSIDHGLLYSLVQACRLGGADALVRLRPGAYPEVLHLLESGVRGLMLPRVRSAAEVRAVVDMMKFPPAGRRGFDGVGPEAAFGRLPAETYMAEANAQSFLVVQIEEPEVIPHLDEIAAEPGVDVLFFGPSDMTLALGKFGRTDDAEVRRMMQQVADTAGRHGKVAGIPCLPEEVAGYHAMGYRFFNVMSDFRCVSQGMQAARAAVPFPPDCRRV